MSTATQYNPNLSLNERLVAAGASKTVYALVSPLVEEVKRELYSDANMETYLDMFRQPWTGKQDAYHEEFFDLWHQWSAPVVDLDRSVFPFYYPTAGASEAIRQIIFDLAAKNPRATIHAFAGEYEGYRAMAEAAGLKFVEHGRDGLDHGWMTRFGSRYNRVAGMMKKNDIFFVSQPSAIDGNVWQDFNEFVSKMPANSVVADLTYVGAVSWEALRGQGKFQLNQPAIRNIVFSLSKPFGVYYDRIGGVFSRTEDLGLFGNRWFKNLTSLAVAKKLLTRFGVFDLPIRFGQAQNAMVMRVRNELGLDVFASDVFILANGESDSDDELVDYLRRGGLKEPVHSNKPLPRGGVRVCLSPGMDALIRG
jgi:histidinol-phosphate/aromatic aminotransferase/cobyric acid decarboxylase-like protein